MRKKINTSFTRFLLGELMRIPVWPIRLLKSGLVDVVRDGKEIIRLRTENGVINIDLLDITSIGESRVKVDKRSVLRALQELKEFADELRKNGLTVTIANNGKTALKLGAGVNPKFSRLITFSKAIEIKSMIELLKIFKKLR